MTYKAIFFDLDGVLTTNHSGGGQTCDYLSKTFDIDPTVIRDVYKPFGKRLGSGQIDYEPVLKALNEATGRPLTLENMCDAFRSAPKNAPMFELARDLKARGLTIGVITDNDKERFTELDKHLGLSSLFGPLIVSADIGSFKDTPEIFVAALKQAEVTASESIFIDNKQANLEAAISLGMKAIWFNDEKNDVEGLANALKELVG